MIFIQKNRPHERPNAPNQPNQPTKPPNKK